MPWRARGDQQGLADLDRRRQGVVGVAGQDHVDARDPRGQLAVDVEAVVAQQDHQLGALGARLGDPLATSFSWMPKDQVGIL